MIGNGMPVYTGYASQYGHGLGNVLGGLFRAAIPFIKPIAKSAGRKLIRAGVDKIERNFLQDKQNVRKRKSSEHMPIKQQAKKRKVTTKKKIVMNKSSKKPRDIFSQ